eukprot:194259_1
MNGILLFKNVVYRNTLLLSNMLHGQSIRTISAFSNRTHHNWNHIGSTMYLHHSYRKESTASQTTKSTIDEVLLSKQEDPMVLKQKEELQRAFAAQLSKSLKRFETSPKMKLKYLLKTIYGCTTIEIKQYCAMFGIHEQTPVKDVPPLFWAVLILHLNRIPRFGAENLLIEAQSIRSMIERKTWKGLRHVQALPVRTKRSRKHFTQRKLGPVRARRLGFLCIREKKHK